MPSLSRNILANLIGGFWIGALTIVITPLQVNLLGMEAYGFLGFIVALQVAISMLDFGLSGTLTREIASDPSPGHRGSMPLLRTATTIYWGLALVIGLALTAAAGRVSTTWLRLDTIKNLDVALGLQITALFIASRWPVALYSGVITGLQRLDILNVVKAATLTIRLLGGIIVLVVTHDLMAFLIWLAISSMIEVLAYAIACRTVFPDWDWRPGFSIEVLQKVWRFSLSVGVLGALSIATTQLDRLVVGSILSLDQLGHYALAHNAALAITLILGAFSSAMMPSLAAAFSSHAHEALARRYDTASRMVVFVTGAIFFPMLFFGDALLRIWVGPQAAAGTWQPLAILAVGYWLSCVGSSPATLAIACGKPHLALQVTSACALVYVPVLYFLTTHWGVIGAATAWVALFGACTLVVTPIVHRRILRRSTLPWYAAVVLPSALLGIGIFGLAKGLVLYAGLTGPIAQLVAVCLAVAVYGCAGLMFLGVETREFMLTMARRIGRGVSPSREAIEREQP